LVLQRHFPRLTDMPAARPPMEEWRTYREADLSAEQARAQASARLPRPHGDPGRPQRHCAAARQGPQASIGLSRAEAAGPSRRDASDVARRRIWRFLSRHSLSRSFGDRTQQMAIATLKRRAEFLRIRGGRRWSGPAFVIEMQARSGSDRPMGAEMGAQNARQGQGAEDRPQPSSAGPPRFGFTATKKLGNAVTRNLIRRRLKEAVRLIAPDRARPGCDYVLIARGPAATRSFAALEQDLVAAFAALHAPATAGSRPARGEPRGGARTISTRGRAARPGPASEG